MNGEKGVSFYPRPLPLLALGFVAGILLGRILRMPFAVGVGICILVLAYIAWRLRLPALPLALLALGLGLMRVQLAYPTLPAPREACTLQGVVAGTPVWNDSRWEIILRDASVDEEAIDGHVRLIVADPNETLCPAYGQSLTANASLSLPEGKRQDGGRDWRFFYLSKGISCTAAAVGEEVRLQHAERIGLYGQLLRLRAYTTDVLHTLLGARNGALAAAMLHGDTSAIPAETLTDFREAGIAHLLSVSGLHVGLLAGALLPLLRHLRAQMQIAAMAGFLCLYCMFAALSPPMLRASIMTLCMMSGQALLRRNDPLSSISMALLALLLYSPFSLYDIGFQLSFAAVYGIALLLPVALAACSALPKAVGDMLGISIAGQWSTLPMMAAYFTRLPLLAVAANVLLVPLAALVMLPALMSVCLYPLLPALAVLPAQIAGGTLELMRAAAAFFADGGSLMLLAPSMLAGSCYYAAMLFLSPYCRGTKQTKRALAAIAALLCVLLWMIPVVLRARPHITVLDARYGYVVHVHTKEEDVLYADRDVRNDAAVLAYLAANGVRDAQMHFSGAALSLQWGSHTLHVVAGGAQADGRAYALEHTGQLRFFMRGENLHADAFAKEARYAILRGKD